MKIIRGSLAIFSMLLILIVCMGMASASDDSILSDNESSTVLQSDEIQVEGGDFEDIQVAIDDVYFCLCLKNHKFAMLHVDLKK